LGVTEAVVQIAGDRRVVVELPGETDPEKALATIKQTGLLEFVDFSQLTQDQALALEFQNIETDFGKSPEDIPSDSSIFHTVMTGADIKNVNVVTTQTGEPQVSFELTDAGSTIFEIYFQ
jgi:preprotein translocase subunit SecD